MEARITLRDLAESTGYAKSTVSLALRNHPLVNEATRQKIQAAAERMGYRHNAALSLVAANRWKAQPNWQSVLAFIQAEGPASNYLEGAHAQAAKLGYRVDFYNIEQEAEFLPLLRTLYSRGIQGLILRCPPHLIQKAEKQLSRFALVSLRRMQPEFSLTEVTTEPRDAVMRCWQEARARGYRRIGAATCTHTPIHPDDTLRYGAVLTQQSAMLRLPDEERIPPLLSAHRNQQNLIAWVQREKPDCVIGFSEFDYWTLIRAGLRIPDELGFAALHVHQSCSGTDPHQWFSGEVAVRQLDQLIRLGSFGFLDEPVSIRVPVLWEERATLPYRKG